MRMLQDPTKMRKKPQMSDTHRRQRSASLILKPSPLWQCDPFFSYGNAIDELLMPNDNSRG